MLILPSEGLPFETLRRKSLAASHEGFVIAATQNNNLPISNNRNFANPLKHVDSTTSVQLSPTLPRKSVTHLNGLAIVSESGFDETLNKVNNAIMVLRKQTQKRSIVPPQTSVSIEFEPGTTDISSSVSTLELTAKDLDTPQTPAIAATGLDDAAPPNTPETLDDEMRASSHPVTPMRKKFRGKRRNDGLDEPREIKQFSPYPCNLEDPADICVDDFLRSQTFKFICAQAFQLAAVLPIDLPPRIFLSFEETPMHQWYHALLMEFVEAFERLLRKRKKFPQRPEIDRSRTYCSDTPYANHMLKLVDDENVFNQEAKIHCNAILESFHFDWSKRPLGSQDQLWIDSGQPNAHYAGLALREVTSYSNWAPKKDWKIGEKLHPEFKRRLRNFDAGVVRIINERPQDRWVLDLPQSLARGTAAYKEYFIAQLRREYSVGKRVGQLSRIPITKKNGGGYSRA